MYIVLLLILIAVFLTFESYLLLCIKEERMYRKKELSPKEMEEFKTLLATQFKNYYKERRKKNGRKNSGYRNHDGAAGI